MPFKSKAQRRKFWAMAQRGEMPKSTVERWEAHTPRKKELPEKVMKKKANWKETGKQIGGGALAGGAIGGLGGMVLGLPIGATIGAVQAPEGQKGQGALAGAGRGALGGAAMGAAGGMGAGGLLGPSSHKLLLLKELANQTGNVDDAFRAWQQDRRVGAQALGGLMGTSGAAGYGAAAGANTKGRSDAKEASLTLKLAYIMGQTDALARLGRK